MNPENIFEKSMEKTSEKNRKLHTYKINGGAK